MGNTFLGGGTVFYFILRFLVPGFFDVAIFVKCLLPTVEDVGVVFSFGFCRSYVC